MTLQDEVASIIRNVPDFPKPGIQFKDITPLLSDAALMDKVTDYFADLYRDKDIDVVVGVESRGFIFGVPLAMRLGLPFVPARKAGKLPADKISHSYALEYGEATLEMHSDSIVSGQKVVVVDDLLATGGTAKATTELIRTLGGEVHAFAFVIELSFLKGREVLSGRVDSILTY
ncbi:MAG: adenine phosphoribosyltransferase [Myxococcota bacterium]|nr:adenine phosphoribosyltransferase [Myxococcota bacterium]